MMTGKGFRRIAILSLVSGMIGAATDTHPLTQIVLMVLGGLMGMVVREEML